jgi:hypothetical protein
MRSSKSEVQCNITYQSGLEKWGDASHPPNLDDHPLSVVRNYLFYIRNYVSRPEACSNRSLRTRIAMATGGRLNGVVLQQSIKVTDKTNTISVHCYYNQTHLFILAIFCRKTETLFSCRMTLW